MQNNTYLSFYDNYFSITNKHTEISNMKKAINYAVLLHVYGL
ncbi:hypothetical protein [Ancylomarina sp. 16SWW S1-10-2]|nr:hypothetical protein [Ancylomarina sp. 16SWW S1-10-2]